MSYYGYIIPAITSAFTVWKYYEYYKRLEYLNSLLEPKLILYKSYKYLTTPAEDKTPLEMHDIKDRPTIGLHTDHS